MTETTNPTPKFRMPYKIKIEPRLENPPGWFSPLLSLSAVVFALLIGALVIKLGGGSPWTAYTHIARYSFGSIGVLSDTLVKATPLILVGLACSLAFRMRLWNIGAEGQFFLGAWGASLIVLLPVLPEEYPAVALYHRYADIWICFWCALGFYSRLVESQIQCQ